jgi:hypothetical protein
MFSRLYIELITLYRKLYDDATNLKNNYNIKSNKDIKFNLEKNKDDIRLIDIYSDFLLNYDKWYITY